MNQNEMIEYRFSETQKISNGIAKGVNFDCPICGIRRIAKAKTSKTEWNHTGCNCTRAWLQKHGQWLE